MSDLTDDELRQICEATPVSMTTEQDDRLFTTVQQIVDTHEAQVKADAYDEGWLRAHHDMCHCDDNEPKGNPYRNSRDGGNSNA